MQPKEVEIVKETDSAYEITVELLGVKMEDVNVQLENGVLSVSGHKETSKEDDKLHTRERFYGSFQRSWSVPEELTEEDVSTSYKNGVLHIELKKKEQLQSHHKGPKMIQIKNSEDSGEQQQQLGGSQQQGQGQQQQSHNQHNRLLPMGYPI